MKRAIGFGLAVVAVALASGLDNVKLEPNLEKRSRLALENANTAIDGARQAYTSGDFAHLTAELAQVRESVNVCLEALDATGKDARKSPKAFKRAELQIRELLRRLKSLDNDVSVEDRPEVQKTEQRLQEVHDELISRIMSKKT